MRERERAGWRLPARQRCPAEHCPAERCPGRPQGL